MGTKDENVGGVGPTLMFFSLQRPILASAEDKSQTVDIRKTDLPLLTCLLHDNCYSISCFIIDHTCYLRLSYIFLSVDNQGCFLVL